jgi:hypothetical protein
MVNPGFITVRCPLCLSISDVRAGGIRTEVFLCPVCLDGEIENTESDGQMAARGRMRRERFGPRLNSLTRFTNN